MGEENEDENNNGVTICQFQSKNMGDDSNMDLIGKINIKSNRSNYNDN